MNVCSNKEPHLSKFDRILTLLTTACAVDSAASQWLLKHSQRQGKAKWQRTAENTEYACSKNLPSCCPERSFVLESLWSGTKMPAKLLDAQCHDWPA